MSTIDLQEGDEKAADDADSRSRRRRRRESSNDDKPSRSSSTSNRGEGEVKGRLNRTFDRIVKQLRSREDEELASAIEEDAEAMTQGLVSLTHNVPFLRGPLVLLLNLIEPFLAFYRVGRILFFRFLERRQARFEAAQQDESVEGAINV